MRQDPRFSADQTLFGQSGSQIRFGDFLIIPVGNGLLYVEPVYVRSNQETAIPELKRVLVANGGDIGLGSTLTQALIDSLGAQVVPPEGGGGGPTPGGTVQQQIAQLLLRALNHFAAADAALKSGDLATYQAEVNAAKAAIRRAGELAAKSRTGSPSPSPSGPPPRRPLRRPLRCPPHRPRRARPAESPQREGCSRSPAWDAAAASRSHQMAWLVVRVAGDADLPIHAFEGMGRDREQPPPS